MILIAKGREKRREKKTRAERGNKDEADNDRSVLAPLQRERECVYVCPPVLRVERTVCSLLEHDAEASGDCSSLRYNVPNNVRNKSDSH